ncbi:MAG: LD-carboxypeptidase [Gemmatimonadetes bacterium]|nr:LD-carboxypeptidase [Gemmatimonadota bacterium]
MRVHPPPSRPRALRPRARIALVAPAGPIDPERIERAAQCCRRLGLEPVVYPSATRRTGYLAGTDEERLADLQGAFDDPKTDGVWTLRGGYGTLRILDRLKLARQRKDPIPFIGFSDHTTIHVRHAAIGVISFHGPHPGAAFPPETEESFRSVLFSEDPPGVLPRRSGDPSPRTLVPGRAEGPLFGGNLALLAALCGSRDAPNARRRILILEDAGEPAYRVDRMLVQLERAGVFEGAAGLAFGRFTGSPDGQDDRTPQVIDEFALRLGIPAVADLPFGHVDHNCTIPLGVRALLDSHAATLSILEGGVKAS